MRMSRHTFSLRSCALDYKQLTALTEGQLIHHRSLIARAVEGKRGPGRAPPNGCTMFYHSTASASAAHRAPRALNAPLFLPLPTWSTLPLCLSFGPCKASDGRATCHRVQSHFGVRVPS